MSTFDPHQFALDAGWGSPHIAATARKGVSDWDRQSLTRAQAAELRRWCREQVRVARSLAL